MPPPPVRSMLANQRFIVSTAGQSDVPTNHVHRTGSVRYREASHTSRSLHNMQTLTPPAFHTSQKCLL